MTTRFEMSRRAFLAGAAAAGLAACSADVLASGRSGDAGPSTRKLSMLNWALYVDTDQPSAPGTVSRFSQTYNTEVTYSEAYNDNTYGQDQVFGPTLEKGKPTGFDIIVPTYWLVADLLSRNLLNELPLEHIPNHRNLDPTLLATSWDEGARYQMPWQAGFTGIAYNPALTGKEIRSFSDLLDRGLDGRVGFVTEMREVLGFLMLTNGEDPSRATADRASAAMDRLESLVNSNLIAKFTGNEYIDSLKSGEFAACMAWSGGVIGLQAERPDIKFVFPAEGAMRWFDSMIIPKGAINIAAAGDFMNFVYDPEQAAHITAAVGYVSPVLGVRDELARLGGDAAKLADSPVLFPDDATRRKLYFWSGTTPHEEAALQARFTKLSST